MVDDFHFAFSFFRAFVILSMFAVHSSKEYSPNNARGPLRL